MSELEVVEIWDSTGIVDARGRVTDTIVDALVHRVRAEGWWVGYLDLRGEPSEREVLLQLELGMQFPGYFGHNWDAARECLLDLSWLPAHGYCIFLVTPKQPSRAIARVSLMLRELADEAHEVWGASGKPFVLVVT